MIRLARCYLQEMKFILYPFMTLEDEAEIVHSHPIDVDGNEQVKVVTSDGI